MVMTSTKSPRLSMLGGVAALTAASIGALFAPALACPPEECPQVVEADPIEIDTESGSDASTFERFMARGGGDDARAAALLEEFREMESRMRSLEALIHEYAASRHPGVAHGGSVVAVSPSAPAPPAAPGPGAALLSGAEIELHYWMPDGRLDDLTSLMSRSDVPVLIRDGEDYIAVIGTVREHEVFLAFARMICPEGVKVTDDQGAEVRWQLDARTPSAPLAPGVDSPRGVLRVAPSSERRKAMEELLDAERTAPRARLRDSDVRRRQVEQEALRAKREYERLLNAADRAGRDRAAAQALERAIAEQEAYINALESSAEELEREQEALEREAEEAAERAEQFQESAAEAAERISDWGRALAEWADSVAGSR